MNSVLKYVLLALVVAVLAFIVFMIWPEKNLQFMESVGEERGKVGDEVGARVVEVGIGMGPARTVRDVPVPRSKGTDFQCKVNKMQDDVNKFIGDIVYGNRFRCQMGPQPFTRGEISDYQDQVFGFGDNVNRSSSHDMVDPVDKMNEYLLNPEDGVALRGKTIGEIYDKMTSNDVTQDRRCQGSECIQYIPKRDGGYALLPKGSMPGPAGGDQLVSTFDSNVQWTEPIRVDDLYDVSKDLDIDKTFQNGMYEEPDGARSNCNWSLPNCEAKNNDVNNGGDFFGKVYGDDIHLKGSMYSYL